MLFLSAKLNPRTTRRGSGHRSRSFFLAFPSFSFLLFFGSFWLNPSSSSSSSPVNPVVITSLNMLKWSSQLLGIRRTMSSVPGSMTWKVTEVFLQPHISPRRPHLCRGRRVRTGQGGPVLGTPAHGYRIQRRRRMKEERELTAVHVCDMKLCVLASGCPADICKAVANSWAKGQQGWRWSEKRWERKGARWQKSG